jgi:hypothetical protein
MGEGGTSPPLLRVKEEYHYHPGCPGCAYDRRKDRLRGMPYKEFLYVWMISLTAGTHFLSLITNTLFLSFFLSFWALQDGISLAYSS